MNPEGAESAASVPYQVLKDEIRSLKDEIQSLRARLEESEELKRALSEGDLDALVIPRPEGEMVFTLDGADREYRVLVETMNEGTATLTNDGIILYCNHKFAKYLRMTLQGIVGTSIYRYIAPEDTTTFEALLEHGKGREEIDLRAKGGTYLPVYLSINAFQSKESPSAWCIVVTDLTEQKKNEEILENIDKVRKQEIHHRIKNNLQVISSLLDLQAEKFSNRECIEDSEVIDAFKESQNRVISMALIHEELYKDNRFKGEGFESEGFELLNFPLYIKKLADNLFHTYRLGNTAVSLNLDLEENLFFDMDTAVPLGIIINELVSNSLKHAFPGKDIGEIRINLCREKDESDGSNLFTLTISDNGVGIPEKIDIEDLESLGLQLVTTLIDQLDGELELKRNNGTEFTVRFTVKEKNNQASVQAPQFVE
ncbi:histidine kinase dimerization/phosphoacceptor domain -containing protein [Methanosarcina sp. Z-7115]|uniref:Histidine kinase dimerization/phosphoacceptor domain -containing protein n=1 Tax=Methanosarcina baikalica TaxID=3073890 RepID=A0ABU2D0B0_9EURY|nr:histidine kinase dimerization/phosphoacceptor domain -containing protein [Methanosarcina sp. Z-7115]MDR7665366.1 histidine kinase dimerization/phosphoacceptor domain -containing protein [Methanosarcina sp. Z-7115]